MIPLCPIDAGYLANDQLAILLVVMTILIFAAALLVYVMLADLLRFLFAELARRMDEREGNSQGL